MRLLRRIPFLMRAPMLAAALMVIVGVIASQQVLLALNGFQDARVRELARLHVEALSVALGPHVLRNDVWEVYDTLTRASSSRSDGRRIAFTVVADAEGRVLAATDPSRAPVGARMADLRADAVRPSELSIDADAPLLRLNAPLIYQGREVGELVTDLDVSDLLSERRRAGQFLIFGNAVATIVLALFGYIATQRLLRPIHALSQRMSADAEGPMPIDKAEIPAGDNELSQLFHTYNRMVAAVSEKNEAERRLAERERFVSLGRLSSSLAHEINNPLGGLMNAADTAFRYADRPEVVRSSAELLTRGLGHLAEVARATLDMNRLERSEAPLSKEDFDDLHVLITPEIRRRRHDLKWRIEATPEVCARLRAAPVRQIALNLLLNAASAAMQDGDIGFTFRHISPEGVEMTVTDSGPGLSDEALQRLTSADAGAPGGGFGLRMVRDLVKDMSGEIAVSRRAGRTEIVITLPLPVNTAGADA